MATIARYDGSLVHTFPHLISQGHNTNGSGAFILFEGRTAPVAARSEHIFNVWDFEAVYGRDEHPQAADLLDLFHTAYTGVDGRLILTTTGAQSTGIDVSQPVEVHSWNVRREPGGIIRITFTATEVDG